MTLGSRATKLASNMLQESESILSKMTKDSKRLLLASIIEKSGLSEKDRSELQNLIMKLGCDSEKGDEHEDT